MTIRVEKGWAISGELGLYVGWWLTRDSAIKHHVHDKRDVPVTITYARPSR